MSSVVVDANVWVSAVDPMDSLQAESRAFLSVLAKRQVKTIVPTFARLEVACALSRRFRNAARGRELSEAIFRSPMVREFPTDVKSIVRSISVGTDQWLRGADAIYATAALENEAILITWDNELVSRARALTPSAWLTANP